MVTTVGKTGLSHSLTIAVSSRALFDLDRENSIFEGKGLRAYSAYQRKNEGKVLAPGAGFPLVRALLNLNAIKKSAVKVEVIIVSRNNVDTGVRIFNSAEAHNLAIQRGVFTSGASVAPYLGAFKTDLFLSASEEDVTNALEAGVAAGLIYHDSKSLAPSETEIRIAFDGDAVLFSDEAERIFQTSGLEAFTASERKQAKVPLGKGPFAKLLKSISDVQATFEPGTCPIRTALVTARGTPSHERAIQTLRSWGVRIDEAFFLGGLSKQEVLRAFNPHIFFDDHEKHCLDAKSVTATARVPSAVRKKGERKPPRRKR